MKRYQVRPVPSKLARRFSPNQQHLDKFTESLASEKPLSQHRFRRLATRSCRRWNSLGNVLASYQVYDSKERRYL